MNKLNLHFISPLGEIFCLLRTLIDEFDYVLLAKILEHNVTQSKFTPHKLINIPPKATVVLIFDTDVQDSTLLYQNISKLKSCTHVKSFVCIPQIRNFEDELCRCCDIKLPKDLTGNKSNKDFKKDFIDQRNISNKLKNKNFDFDKFWISTPLNDFKDIVNSSHLIKKKRKL